MMTSIFLMVSLAINALLFWYIKHMLKKLLFVSDNTGDLLQVMNDFSTHLEQVHSLETFYGDMTLGNLIRHSKDVVAEIKKYEDIYLLTNDIEPEDEEEEPDGTS